MKMFPCTLLAVALVCATSAQAGVVVGGTRLIYDGGKKEASLSVSNPDTKSYLIQTWVEPAGTGAEKAPFMVTPPLFRLDSGQQNVLRVVQAGSTLSSDKESLYWMNIKSIPSTENNDHQNTLQIALKTRIKLIYRPKGVTGVPEAVTEKLHWQRNGSTLQVTNPTPFYMNFMQVKVGGKDVKDVTFVAPGGTASFALPAGANAGSVSWKIISDYGGIGNEHSAAL
ncbi:molecular chaperone [Rahnella bonaserana]|uniref:Fimbria/pilus periplasmic chaperone n=1 Tax=Rahnella bonaserana TaxID=2816248 RepID=A0ABS6LXT7_9GAMM|nr:fimbria/pilus periplasmic chaperone [Rahnella bonaserana]MBU9856920.1 fimbria/pilus periplasmic chaperone [Rahnella bonaserana]